MKTTQIQLRFDAAKLKALEFYLPNNGTSVEQELQKKFDELYDTQVPQNVKNFLKFQTGAKTFEETQDASAELTNASDGGKAA